jgi:FHA domain
MAGLDRFRVVVGAGRGAEAGVVVRLPGVLVVARVGRPETAEMTKRLLALCAEVAGEAGTATTMGRRLVRRVAGLLADADPDQVPDFSLLATVSDRIAALVHGSMEVLAAGPAPLALSGAESATWVDRLLPAEITRIDIGPAGTVGPAGVIGSGVDLGFPLDLRVGAVPGIGATLVTSEAPPLPAPQAAADSLLAGFDAAGEPRTGAERIPVPGDRAPDPLSTAPPMLAPLLSKEEEAHRQRAGAEPTQAADFDELEEDPPTELADRESAAYGHGDAPAGRQHDPHGALHDELTEDEHDALTQLPGQSFTVSDLIEDADEAPTMLPSSAEPQVEGVLCANGHFNHPQAPYCAECGLSLAQQTNRSVWGPRPTVGVLVFDDGQTVNVDTDLVIGRQPDRDDAVRAGTARALAVEDGESAVSRVHAVITLNGWDAVITDRGSANGTYIAPPEATVWTPLNPHQPAPLVPGTRVQVGKRTFVFNSHLHV